MSKLTKERRSVKNKNTVIVNELVVEHLWTKNDVYDNDICYLKIVDPAFRAKLKHLFSWTMKGF